MIKYIAVVVTAFTLIIPTLSHSNEVETTYIEHSMGLRYDSRHGDGISMTMALNSGGSLSTMITHSPMKRLVSPKDCSNKALEVMKGIGLKETDVNDVSENTQITYGYAKTAGGVNIQIKAKCGYEFKNKVLDLRVMFEHTNNTIELQKKIIKVMLSILDYMVENKAIRILEDE